MREGEAVREPGQRGDDGPPPLASSAVLRRADDITVHLSGGSVAIAAGGVRVRGGPHALAILAAFAQPARISAALAEIPVQSAQDWMELSASVLRLYEGGVLEDVARTPSRLHPGLGFDAPRVHVRMLDDGARTSGFISAVERVVRPGDVVADIGTGTGVLAVAAARAGAARVYAIEVGRIANAAERVFEANGVADRVTLVRGHSTHVELPERCDVLVSETIGADPLDESILETVRDARKRLLVPSPRLVPARLAILGLPLSVPAAQLDRWSFTPAAVARWTASYAIDLTPLTEVARASRHLVFVKGVDAKSWPRLTEPVRLADLDLAAVDQLFVDTRAEAAVQARGRLNAVLVYFEADLAPGVRLSTHPDATDADSNWRNPLWIGPDSLDVAPGQKVAVTFRHRAPGTQDGVDVSRMS